MASLSSKIARTTQKLSLKKERNKEGEREGKKGRKERKEAGKATTQSIKDEMASVNI